jgi:hypothetical protein
MVNRQARCQRRGKEPGRRHDESGAGVKDVANGPRIAPASESAAYAVFHYVTERIAPGIRREMLALVPLQRPDGRLISPTADLNASRALAISAAWKTSGFVRTQGTWAGPPDARAANSTLPRAVAHATHGTRTSSTASGVRGALPKLRARVHSDLQSLALPREKVRATVVPAAREKPIPRRQR